MRKIPGQKNSISYKSLGDSQGWSLELATDVSWQNLNGTDSTEAGIVMIQGGNTATQVLWWLNKIKRVCRSAMEAKTMSLNTGIDQAIYVKQVLEELLGRPEDSIPLRALQGFPFRFWDGGWICPPPLVIGDIFQRTKNLIK